MLAAVLEELLGLARDPAVVVERDPARRSVLAQRGLVAATSLSDLDGSFTTVLDCAASPELVERSLELLRPRGLYLAIGYSNVPEFDFAIVARRELDIRGVRSGKRTDLESVIALVASGQLAPAPIMTWSLAKINDALSALRSGTVAGKAVILTGPGQTGQAHD
jgi:alcohol dehydrogenase, propanol-preferring